VRRRRADLRGRRGDRRVGDRVEHEVEDTDDVVEKFKEFLDQVTPEDFAAGDS